jgi:hypothetical protein
MTKKTVGKLKVKKGSKKTNGNEEKEHRQNTGRQKKKKKGNGREMYVRSCSFVGDRSNVKVASKYRIGFPIIKIKLSEQHK